MNRLFTTLALFIFLLAPTIFIESRVDAALWQTSTHLMVDCADEMKCVASVMPCCATSSVISFHSDSDNLNAITTPVSVQSITYFQYKQFPVIGVKSPLYRPPIV